MSQSDIPQSAALPRRHALKFIVLIGVVSLFADMTYEGARSITGPFLGVLGASAAVVGIVSGAGELLGYALRLVSGYLGDRTGRYWTVTIIGYVVNLLAVPLLALAVRWDIAVLLILLERAGRGIRTPARDAMLSHASSQTGLGWGFGLHEALDQTGAVIGPLIVSAVLYVDGGYERGFAVLLIPALLSLVVLAAARLRYPRPSDFELAPPALETTGFSRTFWVYVAAVCCIAAGFADFPLIAFHFQKANIVGPDWIPVFYAIAMAADALAALALGRLFDRIGIWTMMLATVASALSVPLAFLGGASAAVAAMVLWGIGMAAQESVMRAAIASLTPAARRGTAYGLLNAAYGVAWFAGSSLLGVLYDYDIVALVGVAVVLQAASLPLLWHVTRGWPGRPA
jgi:MFS family permease